MGSSATAITPTGFRLNINNAPPDWSTGAVVTTLAAGTTGKGVLNGSSGRGIYNFANGITATSTDRALGVLNSGGNLTPNSIILKFTNNLFSKGRVI